MSRFRMTVAGLIVVATTGLLGVSSTGVAAASPSLLGPHLSLLGPHLCC
ncbi:hypothetical protein [Nocardioides baekrokdamisoli]|nr:hypothetical protein [Nocardioides baekrokdamisoli]